MQRCVFSAYQRYLFLVKSDNAKGHNINKKRTISRVLLYHSNELGNNLQNLRFILPFPILCRTYPVKKIATIPSCATQRMGRAIKGLANGGNCVTRVCARGYVHLHTLWLFAGPQHTAQLNFFGFGYAEITCMMAQ